MKNLLIIIFIALLSISNAQASTFRFDGTLDLYTGSTLTDSASVSGDFSFSGEPFNSDFTGMFTGILFGLPVSGDLTIPNGTQNPVFSALTITWNNNILNGNLLIDISFTTLDLFQITTLDGDNDGIPGSVFSTGPNESNSLALNGQFSAVPLPSAIWLLGSGIALGGFTIRRRSYTKNS